MARDYNKQTLWSYNGYAVDYGHLAFTTTGATLNVYTQLSVIKGFVITPIEAMTTPETFSISGINGTSVTSASIVNGEMRTDAGYVTITRAVPTNTTGAYSPYTLSGRAEAGADAIYLDSNNWLAVPCGYVHTAGNITRVAYMQLTTHSTPGLINLGKRVAAGTHTADTFISDTENQAVPASTVSKIITADAAFKSRAVAVGDIVTVSTTGAGGVPTGLMCDVTITPTAPSLTSGLNIYYMFWGY